MAAKNYGDTKRFVYREPSRAPEVYSTPASVPGPTRSATTLPANAPSPLTATRSADVLAPREEVTPARRIVVVRNPKQPQIDQTKPIDLDEFDRSNSVELSPRVTDGRTAVYVIRRPIPSTNEQKPTTNYQPLEEPLKRLPTGLQYTQAPPSNQRTNARSTPPQSPSLHRSSTKHRSPSPHRLSARHRSPSPHHSSHRHHSSNRNRSPSPQRSSARHRSSSPHHSSARHRSPSPHHSSHRHHSPSPHHSSARHRSSSPVERHSSTSFYYLKTPPPPNEYVRTPPHSPNLRRSPTRYRSPSPQPSPTKHSSTNNLPSPSPESKKHPNTHPKPSTLVRTKSTGVQATTTVVANHDRKKSSGSQAKSVILVNPDSHTVAIIENSYLNENTSNSTSKSSKSIKKTRFIDEVEETRIKTSRWKSCVGCLSRHICLIIIICFILILIGLAGAAVSAYFLGTRSSSSTTPTAVGIAVGAALAIGALCFLCLVLACIGSRDGYFSYGGSGSYIGGTAYALIPPSHPKAYLYIPREYMEIAENTRKSTTAHVAPMASVSNQAYVQPQQHRQPHPYQEQNQRERSGRPVTARYPTSASSNKKNMTIEMPERLLTGRQLSARSHDRSLTKVVKDIGHIVEDAKKRHNGNAPNKVIVKIDKNAWETA